MEGVPYRDAQLDRHTRSGKNGLREGLQLCYMMALRSVVAFGDCSNQMWADIVHARVDVKRKVVFDTPAGR